MAADQTMGTLGGVRGVMAWWVRTSEGRGRVGHLGWRVLAVLVLVLAMVLPWGPVASGDETDLPDGPTAQEASEAREAVRAGELDVAEAEAALAGLREELASAQVRVQMAAADHEDAVLALDVAEAEVRAARQAARRAGDAEAGARAGLAEVYRATQRGGGADGALGPLEVVLDAENVDDLIGRDAAERAVRRKLATALAGYSDARAASESADARWSAAREQRAEAQAAAEAAFEAAQAAAADLVERTEAAERDRTVLIERLADLRDSSVRIERERDAARAAAEQAEKEAEARAALDAARAEAEEEGADDGASGDGEPSGDGESSGGSDSSDSDSSGGDSAAQAPAEPAPGPAPGPAPAPEPPPNPGPAPEPPAPGAGSAEQGQVAVGWARTKIGAPYELGAEGPTAYDCSGLTSEAWLYAGEWITRTSRSQYVAVGKIDYAELRPGDLIFYGSDPSDPQSIYHVAMYTGDGRMIEAVMPGVALRETDLRLAGAMPSAGRP
ncbi:hypothetical protein GCM10028784_31650 [Myceligenerans cantabricum]